jgi:hypothetical protein
MAKPWWKVTPADTSHVAIIGAMNNSQAVALQSIFQSDKAIGWTSHGSGT